MRIAIVTGFFLPVPAIRGGASEKAWHGLAKIFAAKGHDVTFVSRIVPGLAASERVDNVLQIRIPGFDHTRWLPVNLLLDLIWGIRAARVLPPGDAVICNSVTLPVWLGQFHRAAGRVAVMMGRVPKGQVRFYRNVARIYAPSAAVARRIKPRWATDRTRIMGYPIDWPLHSGASAQSGSPVTIGFVGRLHPEKGISVLIKAARRLATRADLPEWRLQIVGPGSIAEGGGGDIWMAALKKEAAPLGGRVEWLGPEFDTVRLASLFGGMDIFCYPSLAKQGETFGVAVAEAMAARCAVVVSGLACFSELVADGRTGLVFDHTAEAPDENLADCLGRLIMDVGLREGLASRGHQHSRKFDYSEVAEFILDDLAHVTRTPLKDRTI
jgi:glycosyltransferase involved in cell wall biosynthesis